MGYDVNKLGNRLPGVVDTKTGLIASWANQENHMEPNPQPPSVLENILRIGKLIVVALAAASASLLAAAAGGATIPAGLLSAAGIIVALASALGIASNGVAKPQPKPSTDAQGAALIAKVEADLSKKQE